jgi:thiol-disulfide isomerase/thioredoxin
MRLAVFVAFLAGCGAEPAVTKPTASTPAKKPVAAESTKAQIRVQQIDKAGLSAVIAHLPGNVVLVDYWATWCPKCRENFPHSVELSRKYGPAGLVVISLACDDADNADQVLDFLREQNATFQNLRSAFGSTENTFEDFEIAGGALPHYKLFDRKGRLNRTFASGPDADEQFTLDDVDAAIEELLSVKPEDDAVEPGPDQPAMPDDAG